MKNLLLNKSLLYIILLLFIGYIRVGNSSVYNKGEIKKYKVTIEKEEQSSIDSNVPSRKTSRINFIIKEEVKETTLKHLIFNIEFDEMEVLFEERNYKIDLKNKVIRLTITHEDNNFSFNNLDKIVNQNHLLKEMTLNEIFQYISKVIYQRLPNSKLSLGEKWMNLVGIFNPVNNKQVSIEHNMVIESSEIIQGFNCVRVSIKSKFPEGIESLVDSDGITTEIQTTGKGDGYLFYDINTQRVVKYIFSISIDALCKTLIPQGDTISLKANSSLNFNLELIK